MAQTLINVGTTPNDGTGDGIQVAGTKINDNFEELYAKPSVLSDIRFEGNKLISNASNADVVLEASGTGSVILGSLRFNDNNIEAIRSNDGLNIVPSGTGGVKVAGIRVSTNEIQTWRSNDDIIFTPSGTGQVVLGGGIVSIPQTLTVSSIISTRGLSLEDNGAIEQGITNADLQLNVNGTGAVILAQNIEVSSSEITTFTSNADLSLNTNGTGLINFKTDTQTTVGAVGAATHLPLDSANEIRPVGYLRIKVSGTEYVIPYFNAS